jgi:hypothetical protein
MEVRFGVPAVLLGLVGAGALLAGYHILAEGDVDRVSSSFDFSEVPGAARGTLPLPRSQSSLGLLKMEGLAGRQPADAKLDPKSRAQADFTRTAQRYEKTVWRFGSAFTKTHPKVYQYGREWMSYPDLKRLNDDYFVDHDPIKFLVGLSRSENFPKLVRKYAAEPELREYVLAGVKQAPADLTEAAVNMVQKDAQTRAFIVGIGQAMGLPSAVMAAVTDPNASPDRLKTDEVVAEILKDPKLREASQPQPPAPKR